VSGYPDEPRDEPRDEQRERARSERTAILLILGLGGMAMLGFVLLGFAIWLDW